MDSEKLKQAAELSCWVMDHIDELTAEQIKQYKAEVLRLKQEAEQRPLWTKPEAAK